MTARDQVTAEVQRLQGVLDRRGQFWEDEAAEFRAFSQVLKWMDMDKAEVERIEAEAAAAAAIDPHKATKEMFRSYREQTRAYPRPRKDE